MGRLNKKYWYEPVSEFQAIFICEILDQIEEKPKWDKNSLIKEYIKDSYKNRKEEVLEYSAELKKDVLDITDQIIKANWEAFIDIDLELIMALRQASLNMILYDLKERNIEISEEQYYRDSFDWLIQYFNQNKLSDDRIHSLEKWLVEKLGEESNIIIQHLDNFICSNYDPYEFIIRSVKDIGEEKFEHIFYRFPDISSYLKTVYYHH